MAPDDRLYQVTHEWAKLDGNVVTVGITKHAVEELTDLVYLDLPEAGRDIKKGEAFGEIESVKAVSELISPVDGKIVEVHEEIADDLDAVSADPYDAGWMVKVEMSGEPALDGLMTAEQYEKQAKEEG